MFSNLNNNRKMIEGAFKKLKSYYYYDKTILFNKACLSSWESDFEIMSKRIDKLAEFMCSLENKIDYQYLNSLLRSVSLVPMPKSFHENESDASELIVQNVVPKCRSISKVNFYIKAPVELLILDTIWMLMIGKIAYQQNAITPAAFANKPKIWQLYSDDQDLYSGIDFESNRLFVPYFKQYRSWRNLAFKKARSMFEAKKDSIIISLDIKSYYYSVVFNFNNLPKYLNYDSRLKDIIPLTKTIEKLYINYTAEMQKYRGAIPADCKNKECAFPIGLQSSMLLANLYLTELDNEIQKRVSPEYYGRYVDDILIVVNKPIGIELNITDILSETLVKNGIISQKNEREYNIQIPRNGTNPLTLQSDKIRCIYLDHNEPDALLKLICEASEIKASMSENALMPDVVISEHSFDQHAYSLGERFGALKIRDFLFSSNNYEATIFINNLIRISKNVDTQEPNHKKYISEQLTQIIKFYNASQGIEYRSAWTNVFALALINERYDYFLKFYFQIKQAIETLPEKEIELIDHSKTDIVINNIKTALLEQLRIAAAIAIAPLSVSEVKRQIESEKIKLNGLPGIFSLQDILSNALDIRKANMFNNHFSAFPLISYLQSKDNIDFSYVNISLGDIKEIASKNQSTLPFDNNKINYSPRFIHFDELCFLNFLIQYHVGGNPNYKKIDNISTAFSRINRIDNSMPALEEITYSNMSVKIQRINANSKSRNFENEIIKIALASILIDEKTDISPVLENPFHNLSPKRKQELYSILNEAVRNNANMVVFPEFFLPIQWLEEVYTFSRQNSIAIISGVRYITTNQRAYNYMTIIQPFDSFMYKNAIPLFREKNHYAPAEISALAMKKYNCIDPDTSSIHLISWNDFKYSDLVCYELTNIEYRYLLRGKIDMLLVPELNKDTSYFSSIVESAARDLHCFVVQANTSKYGDSRITGPYKSLYKDIIKIKGGENDVLLVGTADFGIVKRKRNEFPKELESKKAAAWNGKDEQTEEPLIVKSPPAGFYDKNGEKNDTK